MNNKSTPRITFMDILILLPGILLTIGVKTFFGPCGAHEDGSFGSCHWAGQAIFGIGIVLIAIGILHLIMSRPAGKMGLSLAVIPLALLIVLLPKKLIRLCMMGDMRCNAIMRPAVMILGILTAVLAFADVFYQNKYQKG